MGDLPSPSGADAIIRQHKAACLRITALLACKDMLWIGTSAGEKALSKLSPLLSQPLQRNDVINEKLICFGTVLYSYL